MVLFTPFGGKHISFGSTLKPNAASIKLLRELYDEYLPLFDSPYFNIGGDEPWELGEGWSKTKCRKEGACHAWNHAGTKKIDPVLGINRRFLGDKSGKTGEILWNLGLVMDSAPSKLRNQTIFNRLLFWDMDNEPLAVTDIPDTALDLCESAFLDLEAMIQEIAPARDKALLQKELKNAIALARHGIHRLQVYRGARIKPSNLRKNLENAVKTHRSVWLARNHPGGLSESCDHLQQSYQAL